MKKKIIVATLVACLIMLNGACQMNPNPPPVPTESVTPSQTAPTVTPSMTPEQTLQEQLRELLDRNYDLAWNYFIFNTISGEQDDSTPPLSTDGGEWYPVVSDQFPTFAAFHDYVASTYVPAITDQLFGPRQGDESLYKGINGVWCANANIGAGATTNVSWDNYSFTFEQTSDTTLSLDVTVTQYPDDEEADQSGVYPSEPLHLDGTATLINGQWILDHMIVDGTLGI